ncbi:SDR family NAD(P)-dependent oxidoreductase [Beggiatoa alba]|nr:SDR family NAD(P)-dependent oxidoreductase [Beggiatoa alba]
MKKAIIIGATSGIGRELAKVLSANGYILGITGRRLHLLEQLKDELSNQTYIKPMDISNERARSDLQKLIDEMQGIDLVVISAGIGSIDPKLPWQKEKETIETNVLGFTAMANVAYLHFQQQGVGHLLGISSIAAIRGGGAPAYNASKAFVSNYLQSLRYITKTNKNNIVVTDVQPGFVDTKMAQGEGLFWVASPQKAAAQIYRAIKKKKKHAYITKRWRLIGWVLKVMPDILYNKL